MIRRDGHLNTDIMSTWFFHSANNFLQFIGNTNPHLAVLRGIIPFPMEPKWFHRKHPSLIQAAPGHITVPDELQELRSNSNSSAPLTRRQR